MPASASAAKPGNGRSTSVGYRTGDGTGDGTTVGTAAIARVLVTGSGGTGQSHGK
jgi:hypothetical protein